MRPIRIATNMDQTDHSTIRSIRAFLLRSYNVTHSTPAKIKHRMTSRALVTKAIFGRYLVDGQKIWTKLPLFLQEDGPYYCPLLYPVSYPRCTLVLRIRFCSKKTDFSVQIFKSYLGIQYGTFFAEKKRKSFFFRYVKSY